MGVVYYASKTLSLYGRIPFTLDENIYIALMVAGYILSICVHCVFPKKAIIIGKICYIIAIISAVAALLPISEKVISLFLCISIFICVFLIGNVYTIETLLFDKNTELKYCLFGAVIGFVLIALFQSELFVISFIAFEIISIILLLMLVLAYFLLPNEIETKIISLKTARKDRAIPARLLVGIIFTFFAVTVILVFGLTIAEAARYGVGIFYLSGSVAALCWLILILKFKFSAFKTFIFAFSSAIFGFVLAALSPYYPLLIYPSIVLLGFASFTGNICGLLTNAIAYLRPTRFISQALTAIGLTVAILQTVLLAAFRSNLPLLFAIMSLFAIVMLIVFINMEHSLSFNWKKRVVHRIKYIEDTKNETENENLQTATENETEENHSPLFENLSSRENEIASLILSGYRHQPNCNLMLSYVSIRR